MMVWQLSPWNILNVCLPYGPEVKNTPPHQSTGPWARLKHKQVCMGKQHLMGLPPAPRPRTPSSSVTLIQPMKCQVGLWRPLSYTMSSCNLNMWLMHTYVQIQKCFMVSIKKLCFAHLFTTYSLRGISINIIKSKASQRAECRTLNNSWVFYKSNSG